jgi:hypothetical protein
LRSCTKEQVDKRNQLVEEAHLLRAADERRGRRDSYDSYIRRAWNMVNAEKAHVRARVDVSKDIEKRRKAAIASPSGTNGKQPNPRASAADHVRQAFQRAGMSIF